MNTQQITSLLPELRAFLDRFRPYFKRAKTFEYLARYVGGLMTDVERKSIEPIALAMDVPVRTLQEFLAFFVWEDQRLDDALQRWVADTHATPTALGILDASGHPKQGDKTPGVQHQYCGERGKQANCVVGQHLLYADGDAANPFTCVLDSQLYLPRSWIDDPDRCREAQIPANAVFRTKWQIGLDQIRRAIGNGVHMDYVVADADYGRAPAFWFGLDALGQRGVAGVPPDFACWTRRPTCCSSRAEHGSKRVDHVARYSPVFRDLPWKTTKIRMMTRGMSIFRSKAARVHLVAEKIKSRHRPSIPTDRQYWLIVAENTKTGERKYFVSNDNASASPSSLLRIALERWQVEKWFERAKQTCGFGAFEVRTYASLIRHWLCSRLAMLFLASQTKRLRGEKSEDHVRASRACGAYASGKDVEPLATKLAVTDKSLPLLPAAQ